MKKLTNYTMWLTLIDICENFFKESIMGTIKALGLQQSSFRWSMMTYFCVTYPLCYFLVFEIQKFGYLTDTSEETNNRGSGIWIALVIGSAMQIIGYLLIINKANWQNIADESLERQSILTGGSKVDMSVLPSLGKLERSITPSNYKSNSTAIQSSIQYD